MADQSGGERTLGQLVADASREMSELVRYEVALAKAELRSEVRNAGLAGGLFAVAGYLAFLASILLVIAAGYGLVAAGLEPWLAFLVLAGALLLLTLLLALVGRGRIAKVKPPERTIRSTRALAELKPGGPGNGAPPAAAAEPDPNRAGLNGRREGGPQ